VLVEGTARLVDLPTDIEIAYRDKYGEAIPPGEPVFRLAPTVAFGLSDAVGEFARATRWHFPPQRP
jgi:hypothetical protein